ncbi:transmembrane protein, putative [Medicago truncatula]|uniref:Transmembrane protein, putative n=1 Tax=Medicago truncatula TaxID=3880 RepID=A0A072VH96_MEDTR|nr:transmembrane protein, putative [Medicago truncatula]
MGWVYGQKMFRKSIFMFKSKESENEVLWRVGLMNKVDTLGIEFRVIKFLIVMASFAEQNTKRRKHNLIFAAFTTFAASTFSPFAASTFTTFPPFAASTFYAFPPWWHLGWVRERVSHYGRVFFYHKIKEVHRF